MIKASVCLPPVAKSRDHQTRARVAVGALLSVEIADLGRDGQGVGRVGDQVLFVADALPGELVRVRVVHQARRHLVAELKGIERPSPDRRQPPCILSDNCGGCSLQHCSDAAQVSWKQGMVGEVLRRLGGTELPPLPLLAAGVVASLRSLSAPRSRVVVVLASDLSSCGQHWLAVVVVVSVSRTDAGR